MFTVRMTTSRLSGNNRFLAAAKRQFFDREKVMRKLSPARRRYLSKAAAFVRNTARRSIRRRKRGYSKPGNPPYSKTGLLKRFILFGYDEQADDMLVGATQLSHHSDAPEMLEHGGTTTRNVFGKRKRARYEARPFMRPALEQERPNFPKIWRDSVR